MNYIPQICTLIAILATGFASYSDLKQGIISNKLTLPLIGLGLFLNGIYALITGFYFFIVFGFIFTTVIFTLGYLFWRLGAWAGGDVKLFTALAALLPFQPLIVSYSFHGFKMPFLANYPFPLTIIINSILSTLPFLLLFVFYIGYKEKPQVLSLMADPIKDYRENLVRCLIVSSSITLTWLILPYIPFQWIWLSLVMIYFLVLIISKFPVLVKAGVVVVVLSYSLYINWQITISGVLLIFLSITLVSLIKKLLTSVNKEALQDEIKIDDLKEGMIAAYSLYERDGEVYIDDEGVWSKIKSSALKGDLMGLSAPKGKLLVGSLAAGLTEKELKTLKNLRDEKKIEDSFRIKRGVPFAPAILIGLIISLFLGDLALFFFKVIQTII